MNTTATGFGYAPFEVEELRDGYYRIWLPGGHPTHSYTSREQALRHARIFRATHAAWRTVTQTYTSPGGRHMAVLSCGHRLRVAGAENPAEAICRVCLRRSQEREP